MKEADIIDRQFLQKIRDAAIAMTHGNLNPTWVRAYLSLADAADKLDAMNARITVESQNCIAPDCDCDGSSGCEYEESLDTDCGPYGRKRY